MPNVTFIDERNGPDGPEYKVEVTQIGPDSGTVYIDGPQDPVMREIIVDILQKEPIVDGNVHRITFSAPIDTPMAANLQKHLKDEHGIDTGLVGDGKPAPANDFDSQMIARLAQKYLANA